MMRRNLIACGLLSVMFAPALADWPTYQKNAARVATTDEALAAPLALRWVYTSPAPPLSAWSGPRSTPIEGQLMRHRVRFDDALHVVAAGDRAYFGSPVNHKVYCVHAQTGKVEWTFFAEGPVRLAPTIADGKIYFGADDGWVYCLSADKGELIWKYRPSLRDERLLARGHMISRWPIRTGVLIDDGVAYFGAGVFPHETVYLCALQAATGKVIWKNDRISQQDAGRNDLSPQGYLLASDDLLFVPSGRSLPVAFDKKSGEMVHGRKHGWRSTAGGVVGGTRALLGDGQLYASGPHHFLAMDQKTGQVGHAWIHGRQMTLFGDKAAIATGEAVVLVNRDAHAKASIERQELFIKLRQVPSQQRADIEKERTRLAGVGVQWSAANQADGALAAAPNLVFAGGAGRVTAYDVESGKESWHAEVEGDVRGLSIASGTLFVSTDAGKVYAFSDSDNTPQKFAVGEFPPKSNAPIFAKDQLSETYQQAAQQIIEQTGVRRGFCLVLGSEQGRLAGELAAQTDLRIYGVEQDAEKVRAARDALDRAGLYGHRVTILQGDAEKIGLSNYFANLVVSDSLLIDGKLPEQLARTAQHVKPLGGTICLGGPAQTVDKSVIQAAAGVLEKMLLPKEAEVKTSDQWAVLTRGELPGVGVWSHQYGTPANTCNSGDQRVKGGLGVLWYGDPGPGNMINRHDAAAAPLSIGGRMFAQGVDSIMCYDAYNGLFLWERKNPGAVRTGVFNNEDVSNLAATEDALFMCAGDTCIEIDAATGETRREHKTPQSADDIERAWGYVAVTDGKLFGTSTVRCELRRELRRRGRTVENATDAIFAVNLKTGKREWAYRGKNIMHMTIAIGDGRAFFIDSTISPETREEFLRQDKTELQKLTGKEREKAEAELKRRDVRLAVALDAGSGETLWSKPVDVTDCSHLSIGGGQLTLMYDEGRVVICGANANGHFWRQFLSGEFNRRRLLVLDAKTGEKQWAKDANYRHRPIIVGNQIIAEPWAFDLASGEEIKRTHPLTGEPTKWSFSRPGHHCGAISASPNMLFFRSGFTGYYDLYSDSGTKHFAGQRLGCWINALPANGLVVIPEASAGCVCLFSIASTVVLEPRNDRDAWGIYSAQGARTPVKEMAVNLGAPGDRRDQQDRLWLAYPRPQTVGRLEYVFDIKPTLAKGGEFYTRNDEAVEVGGTNTPWLYSSGARGLTRCELPLLGKDDAPAKYTVKLHFARLADDPVEVSTFDIRLQGEPVARNISIVKEAGGSGKAWIRSFNDIPVTDKLVIELLPTGKDLKPAELPTISAIEVVRQ